MPTEAHLNPPSHNARRAPAQVNPLTVACVNACRKRKKRKKLVKRKKREESAGGLVNS